MIYLYVTVVPALIIIVTLNLYRLRHETKEKLALQHSEEKWEAWRKEQLKQKELAQQSFQEACNALIKKYGDTIMRIKLKYNKFSIDSYLLIFEQSKVLYCMPKNTNLATF